MSDGKLGGNIGMPKWVPGVIRTPGGGGGDPVAPEDGKELSSDEAQKVVDRAKKRWDLAESADSHNRDAGRADDQMYIGEQWDATDKQVRIDQKRATLTFNKFPTFAQQVTNDYRMNRMGITVLPMDDGADERTAKIQAGWIKAVERRCRADLAYDCGFEAAVRKGYGYWRILIEYEGEKSFNQIPVAQRILNSDSVRIDPGCLQFDASDARWAHVAEMMPRDQFKEEYPAAEQMPWPLQSTSPINYGTWTDEYAIRVCEYFEVTREKRTLVRLANGHVGWKEFLTKEALGAADRHVIESRESWEKTMTWYKLTAVEVLEWTTWPIEMIPIVRTVGAEVNVEGKTHVWGIVRQARDAQRAYNYWRSKEAESIALVPNSPYIAAEGQLEDTEQDWKTANQKPIPVLIYKPTTYEGHLVPPPHREPPPQVPAAFVQAAKGAEEDMMGTTGIRFSATPQERVYDESGRALREVRKSGDIGTFHYVDNFAQALRRTGEIYLAIMKAVMVEPRFDTVTEEDGKDKLVKFDPAAAKPYAKGKHPVTGKTIEIVNPMLGQYGTTVAIGPDYATKRVESRESMMDLARAVGPEKTGMVADIIARNEDFPGKDEIAERWAAALPPGLVRPKMDDVPPQVQAVIGQMQQKIQQDAQQMQAMMKELNDRQQELGLQRDKQEKDFEAKILGVVQKAEAASQAHFGSQLKDLAEAVKSMEKLLSGSANE